MPGLRQRGGDGRALGRADDVHVVDVARLVERQVDGLAEPELGVARRTLAAAVVPALEVRQEDAQRGGLDRVEPRVGADELEGLLVARAVEAEHPHPLGHLVVATGDEAAVAEREEVLGREEAEGGADARARDARGAERLRGILDQRQPEGGELGERRGAAEEVHRHDRLRPRRDARGDVVGIEVERDRVDVGEHRRRAGAGDRLRRRVERERRADHLVAGADPHRLEREHERVGAVRDADRVRHAEIGGRLAARRPRPRARR